MTFRSLTASKVIDIARSNKLSAIEWGGDIHAPPSDLENAKLLGQLTVDAGLKVSSYGSYWRAEDMSSFKSVLSCAIALGAPLIRVWAGSTGRDCTDSYTYTKLKNNLIEAANMAKAEGVSIALEYHSDTLTDSLESTVCLLEDTEGSGILTYWQPPVGMSLQENLSAIQALSDKLANIHVFSWSATERLPLICHENLWHDYINELKKLDSDRYLILEFVKDDDPTQFAADAAVLKRWIGENGEVGEIGKIQGNLS